MIRQIDMYAGIAARAPRCSYVLLFAYAEIMMMGTWENTNTKVERKVGEVVISGDNL